MPKQGLTGRWCPSFLHQEAEHRERIGASHLHQTGMHKNWELPTEKLYFKLETIEKLLNGGPRSLQISLPISSKMSI